MTAKTELINLEITLSWDEISYGNCVDDVDAEQSKENFEIYFSEKIRNFYWVNDIKFKWSSQWGISFDGGSDSDTEFIFELSQDTYNEGLFWSYSE